jgi:acetyl-CoA C-acetyltransferase
MDALIFDAVRTPRGKGKPEGAISIRTPVDLLVGLLNSLPARSSFDPTFADDLVLGCVTAIADQGGNLARSAVLHAGWPRKVPGVTLNRFCASGLEALNQAAARISAGWEKLIVCGGVECMSRCRMGHDGGALFMDPAVNGGIGFIPQGVAADLLATLEGYPRSELDAWAVRSHRAAAQAHREGRFRNSLIPVFDPAGRLLLDRDENVRPEARLADLASLPPSFAAMGQLAFDAHARLAYPQIERLEHLHHAGNSSAIVDGAALLLVGNRSIARRKGLKPRARIVSTAVVGSEPTLMLTGPAPACRLALRRARRKASDIDLWEINEAFAAVVLKAMAELQVDPVRVNVNGGAIALGHPLGATGAMLVGSLLDELERTGKQTGMVTLCVGGGMGIATLIDRDCRS